MFTRKWEIRLTPPERPGKMPCSPGGNSGGQYNGGVAQLGERVNGIHEVRGSIPLASIARLGNGPRGSETDAQRYTGDRLEVRLGGARE